jgi:hypothetical protein
MMGASGTFDSIRWEHGLDAFANERICLAIGGVFEVEKEIRADTKYGAVRDGGTGRFVLEHDTRDVDRVRV